MRDAWVNSINTVLGIANLTAAPAGDCNFSITDARTGDTAFHFMIGACEVMIGSPCTFNPTVTEVVSVGGVAGEPDLNQLAAAKQASGGTSVVPYAAGGGAAILLMFASVATGALFVRRRSRAR